MKNLTLTILTALTLLSTSCKKEKALEPRNNKPTVTNPSTPNNALVVSETNTSLIMRYEYSNSWVSSKYVSPRADMLKQHYYTQNDVAFLNLKSNGEFNSSLVDRFTYQMDYSQGRIEQTSFVVNNNEFSNIINQVDSSLFNETDHEDQLVSEHNTDVVTVNSNFNLTVTDDTIKINTTTKFFTNTSGDYILIPILLGTQVTSPQLGAFMDGEFDRDAINQEYVSTDVLLSQFNSNSLLDAYNSNSIGYMLATSPVQGTEFNEVFTLANTYDYSTIDDVKVMIIMAKRDGQKLTIVNTFTK